MGAESLSIEVDAKAATGAYRAFENWAGSQNIKVFFNPDTMMAVARPGRRGWLYDEVHIVTLWIAEGGQSLLELLSAGSNDPAQVMVKPSSDEPNPEQLLALVLEHGYSIDEVRHLL